MSEMVRFESSLTIDEVEKNFDDFDFFSGIMEGLNEALAHEKGKVMKHFQEKVLCPM